MIGRPRIPLEDRLWSKIDRTSECWIWMASKCPRGYGHIGIDGRVRLAHRVVYELVKGPIPEGLDLDHLCRVRACVNPAHLEPVTHRENILRGENHVARQARQTHCKRGHPFSEANTYRSPANKRECRICTRARKNARRRLAARVNT